MANWADDMIAGQLGYVYCVLFPRAREAIHYWTGITKRTLNLPTNVCRVALDWAAGQVALLPIDDSGLAPGITTQLYGYREEGDGKSEMDLDPLGTGFFARPCAKSSIVSFSEKKFIVVGGAAFSTNDQGLAEEMEKYSYFPKAHEATLKVLLNPQLGGLDIMRDKLRTRAYLWDRHLGDSLQRLNREQVIPWRVMRKAKDIAERDLIVRSLRLNGYDAGTNYPAIDQKNDFENRVLNFFLSEDYDEERIKRACNLVKRAVGALS